MLKDEGPVNALRTQNLAGGHFWGHEIRLVFVSLSQGSYMSRRVKFKAFSRTFKAMYQEIQGPMGWKEGFRKQ